MAVLKFEGWSISNPLASFLTEEFRKTIRELDVFLVQDSGITNQVNIFLPEVRIIGHVGTKNVQ